MSKYSEQYGQELEARGFEWTPERQERIRRRTLGRAAAQRVRNRAMVGLGGTLAVLAALFLLVSKGAFSLPGFAVPADGAAEMATTQLSEATQVQTTPHFAPKANEQLSLGPNERALQMSDGSTVRYVGEEQAVRVREDAAEHMHLEVLSGRAAFDVTSNAQRIFEVSAQGVTVRVVGTRFVVEPRGQQTFVEVLEGKVLVSYGDKNVLLSAGDSGLYAGNVSAAEASDGAGREGLAVEGAGSVAAGQGRPSTSATGSQTGQSSAAASQSAARTAVAELMRQADQARAQGNADRAIEVLRQVVQRYPDDPQAGVASFVLGRLLVAEGKDKEAMAAFDQAQGPGARGPLSEEALARQVELAAKRGDATRVRRLAREFERRYPKSARRQEIRRFVQAL